MKMILIDPSKCLQCGNCMIACKDEHSDNDWSPIAAPQSEGQFWIRIEQKEVSSGTRIREERIPVLCQHCADADCITACKEGAIYRRDDGIVIIDPKKCTGCDDCIEACAYDAIFKNKELNICQKCTLCAHLLDAGWERPRCVTACPVDALMVMDIMDLIQENLYAPLEKLKPKLDDKPLIAYVNLPCPFVGGEVVSSVDGALLRDVKVTALHQVTGTKAKVFTNAFGDFDIERLEPGYYTLRFEKDGFERKEVRNIDLRAPKNVETVILCPAV